MNDGSKVTGSETELKLIHESHDIQALWMSGNTAAVMTTAICSKYELIREKCWHCNHMAKVNISL